METQVERIDVERCLRAMRDIRVEGSPVGPVREKAIEDALAAIAADGKTALVERYIGVKVYAGFGDQREDHLYGQSPRHGDIVFRIARTKPGRPAAAMTAAEHNASLPVLGADHMYLLECVRDFGAWEEQEPHPHSPGYKVRHVRNLCDTLRMLTEAEERVAMLREKVEEASVEVHATTPEAPHA